MWNAPSSASLPNPYIAGICGQGRNDRGLEKLEVMVNRNLMGFNKKKHKALQLGME